MRALSVAVLGLSLSPLSHADRVNLQLSDETFGARYSTSRLSQTANVDVDWLHHVDNGDVVGAGVLVEQVTGASGNSAALGGKVVTIFNDVDDAYAVALGGRADFGIPSVPKLRVGGHVWLAPKVTSFNDADSFQDWGVRVGYQALQRGQIYVGYQYAKVGYEDHADVKVADNIGVGMELSF